MISAIVDLVLSEKTTKGSGIRYSGEQEITHDNYHPQTIEYKEYLRVEDGIISHDEVLKLGAFLFSKYPLINKILADTYDYLLHLLNASNFRKIQAFQPRCPNHEIMPKSSENKRKTPKTLEFSVFGGDKRDRTADLLNAIAHKV